MAITFTDEDLMYLNKEQDMQLRYIRQTVDTLKVKGNTEFCKKCGHMMLYFTVGNAKLLECAFCGNRVARIPVMSLDYAVRIQALNNRPQRFIIFNGRNILPAA